MQEVTVSEMDGVFGGWWSRTETTTPLEIHYMTSPGSPGWMYLNP